MCCMTELVKEIKIGKHLKKFTLVGQADTSLISLSLHKVHLTPQNKGETQYFLAICCLKKRF